MNEYGTTSTTDVDREVEPLRPDSSLGELVSEMTAQFGDLVRKELALARVETTDELRKAKRAAIAGGVAAVAALLALAMLSTALAWLLDEWMDAALAFALVGAAWAIVAGVLAATTKRHLADMRPLPQTTTSIKEDLEWARAQRS